MSDFLRTVMHESRSSSALKRELAAVMFTDVTGYSVLTQKDESSALQLLEDQRKLLRNVIRDFVGREVKTMGDGFLIEFGSALSACQCAIEIQKRIEGKTSSKQDDENLKLRIGIHVGDVVRQGTDIVGDTVNIASRIEPLSLPGGICITQQVFDQVQNKLKVPIEKIGTRYLKNIQLPMTVYKIDLHGKIESTTGLPPSVDSTEQRVAVLPLANISPDPKDEYFADGLTDEIISTLSRIPEFRVIARSSILRYKGETSKSTSDIARELGVASILEGSVRKAGENARITLQLVDAMKEETLWSQEDI